jgi:AraC-like DNA-binding protein
MAKYSAPVTTARNKIIQIVENYIETNLAGPINLKQIAEIVHSSYDNFQHCFSSDYGESPWSYVKRMRLEQAAGLLRHSGNSISNIGEMVGYGTKSSFCKAFTGYFDLSPRSFRNLKYLPVDEHIKQWGHEHLLTMKECEFEKYLSRGRFEFLSERFFNYNRIITIDPVIINRHIHQFIQNEKRVRYGLVATSPDVYCMRYNRVLRIDYGYFTTDCEQDIEFFLKKSFERCKYFVMPFEGELDRVSIYIYQLKDISVKLGIFKLRAPHSFLKVNIQPDLFMEVWIPIQ